MSGVLPPFMEQQSLNTALQQPQEWQFRQWLQDNNVPFNPNAGVTDYDMRGFWQGMMQGHPMARSAIDPNDGLMHYNDYWKTPTHERFSDQSQWAKPGAPTWINDNQLAGQNGRILYDDQKAQLPAFPWSPRR